MHNEQKYAHLKGKKIAILMGGYSAERDVSLQSGEAVWSALVDAGFNAVKVDTQYNIVPQLLECDPDVAFNIVHGTGGEDGRLQAILEALNIPYTGSRVAASAIGMDKLLCKRLWAAEGLATAPFQILEDDFNASELIAQLSLPLVIKPALEGSSVGVSIAHTEEEVAAAYHHAKQFRGQVIAEKYLDGGEYTVPVLNGIALEPIQMKTDRDFYDYHAKYEADDTQYLLPCGLPRADIESMKEQALKAFNSIGAQAWGRVDFMQGGDDMMLLEINTVPGMTSHSLVPMSAAFEGYSFIDLLAAILATAQ